MDNKIKNLQKKTKVDMICSFIVALITVGIAIREFWTYVSMNGTDPKHLTNGIYSFFTFEIIFLLGLILLEVHKAGKPFSKKIINELRVLAVFIIIGGILPDIITTIITDVVNNTSSSIDINFVLSTKNLIVSVIGVIIGILSEIFVYGYELQDDVDSIA